MAHFRGSMQGQRGETSRLGSKSSGLGAVLASWEGAVDVRLYHDEREDYDACEVWLRPHCGRGTSALLYRGPVGSYAPHVSASDEEA